MTAGATKRKPRPIWFSYQVHNTSGEKYDVAIDDSGERDGVWVRFVFMPWPVVRRLHAWLGRALAWHDGQKKIV